MNVTLQSSSWPPYIFASPRDMILMRIERVGKIILETSVELMINSSVAIDIMSSLESLMDEQRRLVVGNVEADNLLAKCIYLFAPVSRIAESLVINDKLINNRPNTTRCTRALRY